jgi:hypothetical protein
LVATPERPIRLVVADPGMRAVDPVPQLVSGSDEVRRGFAVGIFTEMSEMTATNVQQAVARSAARDNARIRGQVPARSHTMDQVRDALQSLPSHGWTAGWTGRRDRALLVLSQLAGLSYPQIAAISAGDLTVAGGVATIRTPGGKTTLKAVDNGLLCGPCALARWVHALDLTVVYPDGRVIATVIARAVPLTADSPHLCHSNNAITDVTRQAALLPPIDQWGHSVRSMMPRATPTTRAPAITRHHSVLSQVARHRADARTDDALHAAGPRTDAAAQRAAGLERRVEQLLEDVVLV